MVVENRDVPKQVRIRTDPDDGHAHRYESIQDAKGTLAVGSQTQAVVAACEHVHHDARAKRSALEYLAGRVPADVLQGVVSRLTTPQMGVRVQVAAEGTRHGTRDDAPAVSVQIDTE